MEPRALWLFALVLAALCTNAFTAPTGLLAGVTDPLAPVSALTSHVTSHGERAARLPLPSVQELEALRKVAQILAMLGQQVIPAIIGEPGSSASDMQDVPEDIVNDD